MHERYAYAALVFLALLLPDRRILALWIVLGVAVTLNLLAAAPPTPEIGRAADRGSARHPRLARHHRHAPAPRGLAAGTASPR